MKKEDSLKDLHIGKIIKDIAHQRQISAKIIAENINLYQKNNANKIYLLDDMDCKDVVIVSYVLKYNILDYIVQKYLPFLSFPECSVSVESRRITIDTKNKRVIIYAPFNNCDFLKKTHIGQNIRKFAEEKGWKQQDMAKHLNCSQSTVSDLYGSKSLKVKTLIHISKSLQYHFIAEIYLSKMFIAPFFDMQAGYTITFTSPQICSEEIIDDTF